MFMLLALNILLFIFLILFFFVNKAKFKSINKFIIEECRLISNYLGSLGCGNLTLIFDLSKQNKKKYLKNISKEIEKIKNEYNNITAIPLERICYVGTDPYLEGIKCAHTMGEYCNGDGGIVIIITVSLDISNLNLRYRGFSNTLKENFPKMSIVKIFEANGDTEKAYNFTKSIVKENNNIKGIYVAGSSMAAPTARALLDINHSEKIKVICHDLGKEIVEYIKQGAITAAILQDPIAQGHDSIMNMYNHIVTGWKPTQPRLLSIMDIVTKENYNDFWDLNEDKMKINEDMITRYVKPIRISDKKIKIAVLGQEWNQFFLQIKSGAITAINKLKDFNVEAEWIVFNQAKRSEKEIIDDIEKLVNKFIDEKYDGIVSIVGLKDIVPYLNKAVESGIPVATFNSEPLGFLSMLIWLERISKKLIAMSNELENGSFQINQAMEQTSITSQNMRNSVINQTEHTAIGVKSTQHLKGMIDNVSNGEKKQMDIVIESSQISNQMSYLIKRFNIQVETMKEVQKEIMFSSEKINEMSNYSNQIETILEKIEYISTQTSILAINASIQAARSHKSGEGFKVIADEIKKLSNDSGKSTSEISKLVKNVQNAIEASINATNKSSNEADKQIKNLFMVTEEMKSLSHTLLETLNNIKNIAEENIYAVKEMEKSSKELENVMSETSNISQDNSSAVEELSSTTLEVSAQMNEIVKQSELLTNIIQVLQGSIAQFDIDKGKY